MLFGFGHLHDLLAGVHPKVDPGIVEARLKYLQRLPFPSQDIKVGKGGRAVYGADDVMKLVVALELLAAGIVPAQAAGLVSENWAEVARGMATAWRRRANPTASTVMVARVDGFDARRGDSGTVLVGTDDYVAAWRKDRSQEDRRATVIDLVAAAKALHDALHPQTPVVQFTYMNREIEAWAAMHSSKVAKTGS